MKIIFSIALIALIFAHPPASAHPVAYKHAIGIMTWNQPFMTDDWVTYSFRSDAAVAFRHMRIEEPGGRMQFYAPQLDYLIKRWNESDLQANIYVYGAYGSMTFQDKGRGAGLGGIEADAESRKYFVLAKYEEMWGELADGFKHAEFRVGIAPYEAEFNEIASWFMIQYQWHPRLNRKSAITPLVRLFYKNFLLETGVSTDGDAMMNFMFHF